MKTLSVAERLIVAADFKPEHGGRKAVRNKVMKLAKSLYGTGVVLKINSALRSSGYNLIDSIHDRGLKVMADLKLNDIKETLATDGALLREARPELLTVMCGTGLDAMKALKAELPCTEVLGVTVLTNLTEQESLGLYGCSIETAVLRFAHLAKVAGLDGLVSSAKEVEMLRQEFGESFTLNTPAIRPIWAIVPGDDQNPERIMTPEKAIKAGADRIVVGRPIILSKKPYDAVMRTLEEIHQAL